jgi:hypothetical protein
VKGRYPDRWETHADDGGEDRQDNGSSHGSSLTRCQSNTRRSQVESSTAICGPILCSATHGGRNSLMTPSRNSQSSQSGVSIATDRPLGQAPSQSNHRNHTQSIKAEGFFSTRQAIDFVNSCHDSPLFSSRERVPQFVSYPPLFEC